MLYHFGDRIKNEWHTSVICAAFAVGCPQSGAVVVLRTRPIVNVQIKIIADPNPVKRDNECPEKVPSDVSGCLTVRVCFTVDFYFRENFWENQRN